MSDNPRNDRKGYQAPRAMRLGEARSGQGNCDHSGSSDLDVCLGEGLSAIGSGCSYSGQSAGGSGCWYSGSVAVGSVCHNDGSSATGSCDDAGSGVAN